MTAGAAPLRERIIRRTALLVGLAFALAGAGTFAQDEASPTNYEFYRHGDAKGGVSTSLIHPALFTGAAVYSFPIKAPPGPGKMQPSLALSYNSRAKHGNAGKGWSLSLPKIVRSTKYGVERAQACGPITCDDGSPTVYAHDAQELSYGTVLQRETDPFGCNAVRYYPRIGHHRRILFCDSDDYWVIVAKNGTWATYGRRSGEGHESKLRADGVTFEYYLDEARNTHDLNWRAWYTAFTPGGSAPSLQQIVYTFLGDADLAAGTVVPPRAVTLVWEPRPDGRAEFVDYSYGFVVVHDRRLHEIVVTVDADQVRRYELGYDADLSVAGEQYSPDSQASMLQRIQEFGTDGSPLPATTFEYEYNVSRVSLQNGFGPLVQYPFPSNSGLERRLNFSTISEAGQQLIDMDGDAYLDLIEVDGLQNWLLTEGNGFGFPNPPSVWNGAPESSVYFVEALRATDTQSTTSLQLYEIIDMNADGLPDFFYGDSPHRVEGRLNGTAGTYFQNFPFGGFGFDTPVPWGWPGRRTEITPGSETDSSRISNRLDAIRQYDLHWDWFGMSAQGFPYAVYTMATLMDGNGDGCPDRFYVDYLTTDATDKIVDGDHHWYFMRNRLCEPVPTPAFAPATRWDFGGLHKPPYLEAKVDVPNWDSYYGEWHSLMYGLLGDINGDGLADLFYNPGQDTTQTGTPFEDYSTSQVYQGTGRGFAPETRTSYAADLAAILAGDVFLQKDFSRHGGGGYSYSFETDIDGQKAALVDMNGDGLKDLVLTVSNAPWNVYLNSGTGFQRNALAWSVPVLCPPPERLYGAPLPHQYCGTDYMSATTLWDIAPYGDGSYWRTTWRMTDFDGSGTPDLIQYVEPALGAGYMTDIKIFLNKHRGQPEVLRRINNLGGGAVTELQYATGDTNRVERGNVHFPLTVVTRIDTYGDPDAYGTHHPTYTSEFFYKKPFYDRFDRELRGFGRVDVFRSDDIGTPRRFEAHYFHTDDPNHAMQDPHTSEVFGGGAEGLVGYKFALFSGPTVGGPYGIGPVEKQVWTKWDVQYLTGRAYVPIRNAVRHYDLKPSTGKRRWTEETFEYDAYANVTRTMLHGEVFDLDPTTGLPVPNGDEITTRTDYAYNTTDYIMDLPAIFRTCVDAECTEVLRHTHYYYDNLPLLEVAKGDLTKLDNLVKYQGADEYWASIIHTYDEFGNIKTTVDSEGELTTFTYHPGGLYLHEEKVTVVKSDDPDESGPDVTLETRHLWDDRFGVNTTSWDYNGRRTETELDAFGRITAIRSTPPDDPAGALVLIEENLYEDTARPLVVRNRKYHGAGGSDYIETVTFTDGLGRPIQEKAPSGCCTWSTTFRQYDYNGQIAREALPYATDNGQAFDPINLRASLPPADIKVRAFDWAGREIKRYLLGNYQGAAQEYYVYVTQYGVWTKQVENAAVNFKQLFFYDAHGRLEGIYEYDGNVIASQTSYFYDTLGNLTRYEDEFGNATVMTYDNRGLQRSVDDPDLSNCRNPTGDPFEPPFDDDCPHRFFYDRNGRLIGSIGAMDQRTSLSLDELGRVYRKTFSSALCPDEFVCFPNNDCGCFEPFEPPVTYVYDEGPNAKGRLTYVSQGDIQFEYDNWGRTIAETRTIEGLTYATRKEYDLAGRLTRMIYPK